MSAGGTGGTGDPQEPAIPEGFGRPADPGVVPTSGFVPEPEAAGAPVEAGLTRAQLQQRARSGLAPAGAGPDGGG
ncbi:MAG: hypothetical protein ACLP2J_03880, partial [Acidimicrobiales bacterium]